jgi:hypothetical protein
VHGFLWVALIIVLVPLVWVLAGRWLSLALGSAVAAVVARPQSVRPIAVDQRRLLLDDRKWDFEGRASNSHSKI